MNWREFVAQVVPMEQAESAARRAGLPTNEEVRRAFIEAVPLHPPIVMPARSRRT